MSNQTQVQTQNRNPESLVEFVPFGAADKIKMSVNIVQNLVAVPTRSGKTCSARDAMRFIMLCQAQRLNPFAGDAFLIGYDGSNGPEFSLITAHQAFLKRAETCKEFEGMESGVILLADNGAIMEREGDFHLPTETVVGGWARVHRTGRKPTYRRIRMERFNKGFAQWKVDPAGMIVKCAESDSLRSTFPTLLGGLYTEGEILDISATVSAGHPKPTFEIPALAAPTVKEGETIPTHGEHSDIPDNEPHTDTEAQQEKPAKEEKPTQNYPKAIKGLLRLAGISEVELIDYLHNSGELDDSIGTLAVMADVKAFTLKKVHDEWATYEKAIKKGKAVAA